LLVGFSAATGAGVGVGVWAGRITPAKVANDKAHRQAIGIRLRTFTVYPH
jgi:hypothetical protein